MKTLFTIVTHQCISLVAAGTEIITVNVLKSIRVVWLIQPYTYDDLKQKNLKMQLYT